LECLFVRYAGIFRMMGASDALDAKGVEFILESTIQMQQEG